MGYSKGDVDKVLTFNQQGITCSNGLKLEKIRFGKEVDRNWFCSRVVGEMEHSVIR